MIFEIAVVVLSERALFCLAGGGGGFFLALRARALAKLAARLGFLGGRRLSLSFSQRVRAPCNRRVDAIVCFGLILQKGCRASGWCK